MVHSSQDHSKHTRNQVDFYPHPPPANGPVKPSGGSAFSLSPLCMPFKKAFPRHSVEPPGELARVTVHARDHHEDPPAKLHPHLHPHPTTPPTPPGVRGNPGPLGLLCFGMTTDMLMFMTTTWVEKAFLPTVFCYAAFYGGLGQFVAGILELIKGNTFAGTAFSSYGCFWMGWFLLEYLSLNNPTLYVAAATGKTMWCGLWAMLTLGFFVVTLRKNGGLMVVFSTLVITFALLAGGVHSAACNQAAGYVGFLCGTSAIYTAFAELYKDELGIVLPGVSPVKFI